MITKDITIRLENGLEARPVAMYESSIFIESGTKKVNAKSIMGMMSLGLDAGETVKAVIDGPDEESAMEGIENFLSGR